MKTLERPKFEGEKKPEKKETEAKYNFEEIAELEKPIESLVHQLKEAIDSGEYDTLIGDDAKARIPTLIFRSIFEKRIRAVNPNLRSKEARSKLKTYFISGGRELSNDESLRQFFLKIKPGVKKALFVTEYIETGKSADRVAKTLEQAGINSFDVLSVMSEFTNDSYTDARGLMGGHRLFVGEAGRAAPKIHFSNIGGTTKGSFPDEKSWAHTKRIFVGDPVIAEARQDVDLMVKRILEKVWGK